MSSFYFILCRFLFTSDLVVYAIQWSIITTPHPLGRLPHPYYNRVHELPRIALSSSISNPKFGSWTDNFDQTTKSVDLNAKITITQNSGSLPEPPKRQNVKKCPPGRAMSGGKCTDTLVNKVPGASKE